MKNIYRNKLMIFAFFAFLLLMSSCEKNHRTFSDFRADYECVVDEHCSNYDFNISYNNDIDYENGYICVNNFCQNNCPEAYEDDDHNGLCRKVCEAGYQDNDENKDCKPDCVKANLTCLGDSYCSDKTGLATCTCAEGLSYSDGSCVKESKYSLDLSYSNLYSITTDGLKNIYLSGSSKNYPKTELVLAKANNKKLQWKRTLESNFSSFEIGFSIALDSNFNIYVTGSTKGHLDGQNKGKKDVFLAKFDNEGNKLWLRQWGTEEDDQGELLLVDSNDEVYVIGYANAYSNDSTSIFLAKYDADGKNLIYNSWNELSDTKPAKLKANVRASSFVLGTKGYLYIAGYDGDEYNNSREALIMKIDIESANNIWTKKFGVSNRNDMAKSIEVDKDDNIYVVGYTTGAFDGYIERASNSKDAVLIKFDSDGKQLWVEQWQDYSSEANDIAIDSQGNLNITGELDISSGTSISSYVFLDKFNSSGEKMHTKKWDFTSNYLINSLAIDAKDNIWILANETIIELIKD